MPSSDVVIIQDIVPVFILHGSRQKKREVEAGRLRTLIRPNSCVEQQHRSERLVVFYTEMTWGQIKLNSSFAQSMIADQL